jgi:hypothetical protein
MSPKRKNTVSEFEKYTPAASQRAEQPEDAENGNTFSFDEEFDPTLAAGFEQMPVVETIQALSIYPDMLQPRPSPLPYNIRVRFRRGEIDAFQAGREWLRQADKNPITLHDISRYISMGDNIAANGQINPITGRWEQAQIRGKEKRIFRIETGEQRFWSAVIHHLRERLNPDELTLKVSVVPSSAAPTEMATVRRQISENRKNMQLTEVLQAREIARLLLVSITEKTGETFTADPEDEYDYFRNVLRIGRVPHGVWDAVQAEFNLGQHRMRQSLEILRFHSTLLDLAHKARLSYRTLSQILKQPEEQWEQAIWEAALQNVELENADEDAASEQEDETEPARGKRVRKMVDPAELAFRGVRRFYRSAIKGVHNNPLMLQSVADNVIMDGYPEEVIVFMEDLIAAIRQRMDYDSQ